MLEKTDYHKHNAEMIYHCFNDLEKKLKARGIFLSSLAQGDHGRRKTS